MPVYRLAVRGAAYADRAGGLVGSLAGTAKVPGDIEAPIASPDVWFRDRA
ncbi:MAG: hypothetical protein HYY76_02835 [Acidobacteria bacterium]|nr:hypothetical protein [Acidobacteriota bacterium]